VPPVEVPKPEIRSDATINLGASFERIAIDIAGHFPESDRVNRYFLIDINNFTMTPDFYALQNEESINGIRCLVKNFASRFSVRLICTSITAVISYPTNARGPGAIGGQQN
jgi:hypothetical protein